MEMQWYWVEEEVEDLVVRDSYDMDYEKDHLVLNNYKVAGMYVADSKLHLKTQVGEAVVEKWDADVVQTICHRHVGHCASTVLHRAGV